ncbi:ribonuclease H-like domain-containing protein [Tanacetum coccineum]
MKRSRIAIVKVQWNSKRGPEFTWEREDQMKLKNVAYPSICVIIDAVGTHVPGMCEGMPKHSAPSWPIWQIIDYGANQRMTISTVNMFVIIDISDLTLTVGHPNGTLAKIKYVGNLRLSKNVVLFDVLVVPQYCASLLSVNKLIKDSRLCVGFTNFKCYIQDLHHNKIMRIGNENGGLYLFDSPSPISFNHETIGNHTATCYVSKSLWHNRLGHPFDQDVDVLQSELNFTKDSHISPCDICHKAKLPSFVLNGKSPFEIVYGNYAPNDEGNNYPCTRSTQTSDGSEDNIATSIDFPENGSQVQPAVRRSSRQSKMPPKFNDYVVGSNVNQRKYCLELFYDYGLLAAKHVDTHLPENTTLNHIESDNDKLISDIGNYQKLIGKLTYLTNTRPDISYVVFCLSQFMHAPLESHLDAALRVLRYLKGLLAVLLKLIKMEILRLKINLRKSKVYGVGVESEELDRMARFMTFVSDLKLDSYRVKASDVFLGEELNAGDDPCLSPRGRAVGDLGDLEELLKEFSNGRDDWKWRLDPNGVFFVRSLSHWIEERRASRMLGINKTGWINVVPKKVNVFVWRAILGRLSVRVELDKRGIDLDPILCPCCKNVMESIDHSLVLCEKALKV